MWTVNRECVAESRCLADRTAGKFWASSAQTHDAGAGATVALEPTEHICLQWNPDGTGDEPRRVTDRTKKGRIKRQMSIKLHTTKYLKTAASADSASVEFAGQVQRIARVHHYGLRDRVGRRGPEVRYIQRQLLGVNKESNDLTLDIFHKYLRPWIHHLPNELLFFVPLECIS